MLETKLAVYLHRLSSDCPFRIGFVGVTLGWQETRVVGHATYANSSYAPAECPCTLVYRFRGLSPEYSLFQESFQLGGIAAKMHVKGVFFVSTKLGFGALHTHRFNM